MDILLTDGCLTVDLFFFLLFLFEKERVYMFTLFLSSLLLSGHHHTNSMVVVAILSSYSYSSGNQLGVVEAIFILFALILYCFFLP